MWASRAPGLVEMIEHKVIEDRRMQILPTMPETRLMGAVDARDILPVQDMYGGVTIYYQGRPTLYLLAGECYRAFPDPEPLSRSKPTAVYASLEKARGPLPILDD